MKDVGLWLNLILPQNVSGNRAPVGNQAAVIRKGCVLRLMNANGAHRVATGTNAHFVQGGIQ